MLSEAKERIRPVVQAAMRAMMNPLSPRIPPAGFVSAEEWCETHKKEKDTSYNVVYPARTVAEPPSISREAKVPHAFVEHAAWHQSRAFVCTLPDARVWGRRGATITTDNLLVSDVSREFGAYNGVYNENHPIFKQLRLASPKKLDGTVAVVATPGSATYFHWLFDVLPRIHLLRKAGLYESADHLIVDYEGLAFQTESLSLMKVSVEKLLTPHRHWDFHVEAKRILVPSLSGDLGTVSDWVVQFLRGTFLGNAYEVPTTRTRRLFISRRKAPSRRETNYDDLLRFLRDEGFEEYFAEDHSVSEAARDFASAEWVIGIHGGGLSNLVFVSPFTNVIEFLPPRHVDSLFWIISNRVNARHAYMYGEGEHPPDGSDLVKEKIDADVTISIPKLRELMKLLSETDR